MSHDPDSQEGGLMGGTGGVPGDVEEAQEDHPFFLVPMRIKVSLALCGFSTYLTFCGVLSAPKLGASFTTLGSRMGDLPALAFLLSLSGFAGLLIARSWSRSLGLGGLRQKVSEKECGDKLWMISIGVIASVWALYFGVVTAFLPRHQWMALALELLAASAMILIAANAVMTAPRTRTVGYHFTVVWGISLPLLVGYLSRLIPRGSASALRLNIMIIVLLYAWVMLTLRIWERRRGFEGGWYGALVLSILGAGIFAGTWGWFTLGDWPMMPYDGYMMEKQPLYLGLGLGFLGAYLIRPKEGREGRRSLVGRLSHKSIAVLVIVLAAAVVLCLTFPPFPFLLLLLLLAYWGRISGRI